MEPTVRAFPSGAAFAAVLLLAGCFGGGGSQSGPGATVPTVADGDVGSVQGLVVDDAYTAISGAQVGFPTLGATTTTDGQGRFLLENIPVGSHDLYANKLSFEQAGQRVTVSSGQTIDVEFQLAPLAAAVAFATVTEYIGFMNCGFGADAVLTAAAVTSACTQDPNHKTSFDFEVQPGAQTAIGELSWTPSAGFAAQSLRLALWQNPRCSPCDPEYDYGDVTGPSPVYLRADKFRGISEQEPTTLWWYVWTPWGGGDLPLILVLNQKFSVYGSLFYGAPAPADHSALPEA